MEKQNARAAALLGLAGMIAGEAVQQQAQPRFATKRQLYGFDLNGPQEVARRKRAIDSGKLQTTEQMERAKRDCKPRTVKRSLAKKRRR